MQKEEENRAPSFFILPSHLEPLLVSAETDSGRHPQILRFAQDAGSYRFRTTTGSCVDASLARRVGWLGTSHPRDAK